MKIKHTKILGVAKAVLGGNFIALKYLFRKEEKF